MNGKIPEGWRECRIGDIATSNMRSVTRDYPFKIIKYLDTGSITCGKLESYQEIPFANAPSRAKRLASDGDIVYSNVRPIQRHYGLLKNPPKNLVVSTGFSVISVDKNRADPRFVYDYLSSDEIVEYLDSVAEGSTSAYPSLRPSDIDNLFILLPPLPEQRAIASVLSSLDDKIDLLHRQNKTLEAMAETLFRQWFVEPCKDGLPEGWEEGKVLDYCVHHKDCIKPQDFPQKLFSHYSIPAFDNNRNPVKENGAAIQSNKYTVVPDCLLFSKLNPNKDKRIWLILDQVGDNPICSTEFQVVLPRKRKYLFFIYCWLSFPQNYNEIASGVGGTSGSHQRIDPDDIFNFPCPIIEETYIDQFHTKIEPLFVKIQNNQTQIRTLEKLRDTLLPKLMSGEVRVQI